MKKPSITNLLELENLPLQNEFTETLLQHAHFRIERIVSKGHQTESGFWYDQEEHEYVGVLKGKGVLEFEGGEQVVLEVGDFINIEAHTKHRVVSTSEKEETVWFAVFYT